MIKSRPGINEYAAKKKGRLLVTEGNKKGYHFFLSLFVCQEKSRIIKYMLYLCAMSFNKEEG